MPHSLTTIGPWTVQTYTVFLAVGILFGIAWMALSYRLNYVVSVGSLVDVSIIMLIGGVLLARGFHVALNWRYFQGHTGEIAHLKAGGFNWHGAVVGTLIGLAAGARWWKLRRAPLLDALAVVLPVIAFMAWWGCGAATCSYGAEVQRMADYPAWATWEAKGEFDLVAPRFATQPLGMAVSGALVVAMIAATRFGWFEGRRFWLSLTLLAVGMLALDSLRGDYAPVFFDLRADQWLDFGFAVVGLVIFARFARRNARTGKMVL